MAGSQLGGSLAVLSEARAGATSLEIKDRMLFTEESLATSGDMGRVKLIAIGPSRGSGPRRKLESISRDSPVRWSCKEMTQYLIHTTS